MTPLSITSLQLSSDSLFGTSLTGASLSSSGTDIFDLIADQYLSKANMRDLNGFYSSQSISMESLGNEDSDVDPLQAVYSVLSGSSITNATDDYSTHLAINNATIGDPTILFGGQATSIGNILNKYA